MASSSETLTLRLVGLHEDLNADAFVDVFRDTLVALREINKAVSKFGNAGLEWRIVAAGMKSPFFATVKGVDPIGGEGSADGPVAIGAWVAGLQHLESKDTCPSFFTEGSLRIAQKLVAVFALGITQIEYTTDSGSKAVASRQVAQNASHVLKVIALDRAKRSGKYVDYGSIEGTLKELTSLEGRDKMVIVDDLTGASIACYFRNKAIEAKARTAWKRRVSVSGEITYDKLTGDPSQVSADDIRPLGTRDTLPQMEDLRGINITGGLEPAEYIRGLRDDD